MKFFYIVICLVFCLQSAKATLDLTKEEQVFIQKHPVINVGIDTKWQSFDAINIEGNYIGIAADYLKIIAKMTGIQFNYIAIENYSHLKEIITQHDLVSQQQSTTNKRIDLMPAIFYTQERAKFLLFTDPYIAVSFYVFAKEDDPQYSNLSKLNGHKVSVIKGFMIEDWLRKNYPGIQVVKAHSVYDGLVSVFNNESTAFINDYPSTNYVLENTFLPGISLNAPVTELSRVKLHMAVRKNLGQLKDIINKVNANLSENTVENIREKWMSQSKISLLNFSKEETKWISSHRKLTFATNADWPPYEMYDSDTDQYYGVANDVLHMIAKRTGIKFKLIKTDTREEAKALLSQGKVDFLPVTSRPKLFEKAYYLSKPYTAVPYMVFGKQQTGMIDDLTQLNNKTVALRKGSKAYYFVKENYPEINILPVDHDDDFITDILNKKSDYFITDLASASYLINSNANAQDIVALYELDLMYTPSIVLSRKLGKTGLNIFNDIIDSISKDEMNKAFDKWIFISNSPAKQTSNLFYYIIFTVFVSILLIISIIFLRIKSKNKQLM